MRLLAFGDSVTNCRYMPEQDGWRAMVAAEFGCEVVNRSLGGRTSRDGLRLIRWAVEETSPDVVVIQFGINDAKPRPRRLRRGRFGGGRQVPAAETSVNVARIVQASPAPIVVLPPSVMCPVEWREAVRTGAAGALVADPDERWPDGWLAGDGIHPNRAGQEAHARAIIATLNHWSAPAFAGSGRVSPSMSVEG